MIGELGFSYNKITHFQKIAYYIAKRLMKRQSVELAEPHDRSRISWVEVNKIQKSKISSKVYITFDEIDVAKIVHLVK